MKITYSLRVMALTATLWTGLASAPAAAADAATLLNQILSAKAKMAEISADQASATADLRGKMRAAADSVRVLSRPPLSEERLREMQFSLAEAKAQVASLEQQLAVAKITDPAAQAAKKNELEQTQVQLKEEIKSASLPFEEGIKNAHKPIEAVRSEWAAALGSYFKTPDTGKFAGITKTELSWHDNDTGQLSWKDASGKQVCWLSVFLDETPSKRSSGQKALDDKYPMHLTGAKSLWVFVGHLKLAMSIDKPEWQTNEETVTEIFKALVDVEGLNRLKPNP